MYFFILHRDRGMRLKVSLEGGREEGQERREGGRENFNIVSLLLPNLPNPDLALQCVLSTTQPQL